MHLSALSNKVGLKNFSKTGVLIIDDVFNAEACVQYREACEKYLGKPNEDNKKTRVMADGPTKHREFWSLFINRKILDYVEQIISGPIVYAQHSDLHINLGTGAFHRDSRNKRFDPQYALNGEVVLRVALYLSDNDGNRGGLLVIPNSHKKQSYLQNKELSFYNRLRWKLRQYNLGELIPQVSFLSETIRIFPKSGSIVVFDQSVVHAGMRPTNKNGHKFSIFWSYGSKTDGTKSHVNFYRGKKGYLQRVPDELKDLLKKENIDVF